MCAEMFWHKMAAVSYQVSAHSWGCLRGNVPLYNVKCFQILKSVI
uniref:Uncharacterized protein n=1 Tax=Anguilla anguilla TaxID=7936 RepID=A0A0E9UIQ5_ANGAN